MRKPRSRDGRIADTLLGVGSRFALLLFVVLAIALLVAGRIEPRILDQSRAVATDLAAPFLDLISKPVGFFSGLMERGENLIYVYRENERLRSENERLRTWQAAAEALAVENQRLRALTDLGEIDATPVTSARVIGQAGGKFVQSVLINAGARDGVAKGQTVTDGLGIVGRIISVGRHSSRVLLVNDLNSRIPVKILPEGVNAILAGNNQRDPMITFLPGKTDINPGDWVVTTGHGGAFPPDIAVGRILPRDGDQPPRVRLEADLDRLDLVRILDYSVPDENDFGENDRMEGAEP